MPEKRLITFVRGPVSPSDGRALDELVLNSVADSFPAGLVFAAVLRRGLKSVTKYPLRPYELFGALK